MLHDKERNEKFEEGLRRAIRIVLDRGHSPHVLDIGTGTGILAMMACRHGAERVTACEAFKPMSCCAKVIIANNNLSGKIKVIPKRSTELTVGFGCDMNEKANILVAELLDTELIGEGALYTYRHAHKYLLTDDCLVVPHAANVYIQLIQSDFLRSHNSLSPWTLPGDRLIRIPEEISNCPGAASVHDIQLSQVSRDKFNILSFPHRTFRFDFSGKSDIPLNDISSDDVDIVLTGLVNVIFMWWDIEFDANSAVTLSCAPSWTEPYSTNWRDHWMQAIYYPSHKLFADKGDSVRVMSYHDDYSLWFDISQSEKTPILFKPNTSHIERPICGCGLHVVCGRQRLAMLSDPIRQRTYTEALMGVISPESICLIIGDVSLLPCLCLSLGCSKVIVISSDRLSQEVTQKFIAANSMEDRTYFCNLESLDSLSSQLDGRKIDVVVSEPYILSGDLPWHSLMCRHTLSDVKMHLSTSVKILPQHSLLKGMAVEFDNLWKICAPVGVCEGFNLSVFDHFIKTSSDLVDPPVDSHPLWEYPCIALTKTFDLLSFDWTNSSRDLTDICTENDILFEYDGECNGVVLWMEHDFINGVISSGIQGQCEVGNYPVWDPFSKQGVVFLRRSHVKKMESYIHCSVKFSMSNMDIDALFDIQ